MTLLQRKPTKPSGIETIEILKPLYALSILQARLDFDEESQRIIRVLQDREVYTQISSTEFKVSMKVRPMDHAPEKVTEIIEPSEGYAIAGRRVTLAFLAHFVKRYESLLIPRKGLIEDSVGFTCSKTFLIHNHESRRKENMYLVAGNSCTDDGSFQLRLTSEFPVGFKSLEIEVVE